MAIGLVKAEVKRWLRGQKVAMEWMEAERIRSLRKLTPEESLRIYFSLLHGELKDGRDLAEPSPLLWAMRRVLMRYGRNKTRPK